MIEKIKQIISDNSEEKHFVEYGKGVFATEDAVDEIAESVVKLFSIHNVVFSEAKLKAKLEEQKEEIRQWLIGEDFEGLAERL